MRKWRYVEAEHNLWFGIAGENDNGRRVIYFCDEEGLCVGNAYFEHKNLHKCIKVVINMTDLVLINKDMSLFVGCESSERNRTRFFRSLCCSM